MLTVLQGDCRDVLKTLADESVQMVCTSPPYWGLRDYGVSGQLGLESTPEEYVTQIVGIFREVRRVLRGDGSVWLNLGDSYSGSWARSSNPGGKGNRSRMQVSNRGSYVGECEASIIPPGLKAKDLCGIPWLVAFALRQDGWYLRSEIIWAKPNPMPESVTDRPTKSHEQIFLLTKRATYFYDAEAIREPHAETSLTRYEYGGNGANGKPYAMRGSEGGRNKRSVWTIATSPYSDAHFATFPPKLIEPCILAGSSSRGCCAECGAPWERVVERRRATFEQVDDPTMKTGRAGWNRARPSLSDRYVLAIPQRELARRLREAADGRGDAMQKVFGSKWDHWTRTDDSGARIPTFEDAKLIKELLGIEIPFGGEATGWQPTCEHEGEPVACTVLDPFAGSGTVGKVALEFGRRAILIELNPKYCEMIQKRAEVTLGLPGLA